MINADKVEEYIVQAKLNGCKDANDASKRLVALYKPDYKLVKGKLKVGPSLIEAMVARTLDAIKENPLEGYVK